MMRMRRFALMAGVMMCLLSCHRVLWGQGAVATLTVLGGEQQGDSSTLQVAFHGFVETVNYGTYSTRASLAAALAARFSSDFHSLGLYAKAGANANTDLSVITFQLIDGSAFGALKITGPANSFSFASSGFTAVDPNPAPPGTVALQLSGQTIATASYGDGSTPAEIAEELAHTAKSSDVSVKAFGANLYLEGRQANASFPYSLSFSTPGPYSSVPSSGQLSSSAPTTVIPLYSYVIADQNGNSGYAPNGNIVNMSDSVTGSWVYQYDPLNRLSSRQGTTAGNPGTNICWMYDDFGNRTHQTFSDQPFVNAAGSGCQAAAGSNSSEVSTVPTGNNQIASITTTNASAVTTTVPIYDAAGNVLQQGTNSFVYDAEERLCAVRGPEGMVGYQYDAEGNRIAKGTITSMSCDLTANGFAVTSEYVLGASGGAETEVNWTGGTPAWTHTNVMAGGALIGSYDAAGLHIFLNDALGSRRLQTDSAGFPEQSCTNLPFGDELLCTASSNAPATNHFTGKERDAESGLDYFGARYMSSSMGRFMSPDWASNPVTIPFANIYDPQSLNLYSYTGNNPLSRYDPDGHLDCSGGATQDVACAVTAAAKSVWHWLTSGSDSGSSTQTSVTTQESYSLPSEAPQQSLMPRNASINFGGGAEAGLGAGFAVTGQASLGLDFKTGALYTMGTNGGTFPAGVYPNAHQSPDPKDWVWSLYAGGGFSASIGNGTEDQMAGKAHTTNLGGRFGPWGAGVSYSYTGTPWKPGVYSITVAPPFANWGAGAQASHFNTNTSVHDLQTTLW